MKPHFFGDKDAPLYGVYDEPRSTVDNPVAVVACYPIAGEYMRAHRAFRQLAGLLTRAGAHVLRFDYYGQGDSSGDPGEARVDLWTRDIATAVEELQELCGLPTVRLVGLRFGATLAYLASGRIDAVSHVVGWDPVVDGPEYVSQMEETHRAEQRGRRSDEDTTGTIGVHGFPVPKALREDIASLGLRSWTVKEGCRADVVVSSEREAWQQFGQRVESAGTGSFILSPSAGGWDEADEFGSALIPQQIIQSVVGCLTGVA